MTDFLVCAEGMFTAVVVVTSVPSGHVMLRRFGRISNLGERAT